MGKLIVPKKSSSEKALEIFAFAMERSTGSKPVQMYRQDVEAIALKIVEESRQAQLEILVWFNHADNTYRSPYWDEVETKVKYLVHDRFTAHQNRS